MNTISFENKGNIKMIAHRGLSGLECENSSAAFKAAGMCTYYGIETDVHVTGDKKYVVHHDDSTKRMTGKNLKIGKTSLFRLRLLRMYEKGKKTKRWDLIIPTLSEYLAICKKYKKTPVIELKEEMSEEDVLSIVNEVLKEGMLDVSVFISFSKANLLHLRRHYPNIPAQYLAEDTSEDTVNFILENSLDADIIHSAVTVEFVELMHKSGRLVNVWTVNTVAAADQMASLGVDMITTNILE